MEEPSSTGLTMYGGSSGWPSARSASGRVRPGGTRTPAAAITVLAVGLCIASAEARMPEWV